MKTVRFDAYRGMESAIGLRLAPIDVGFDLRAEKILVAMSGDTKIASYADRAGERWIVEGTTQEILSLLRREGYCVVIEQPGTPPSTTDGYWRWTREKVQS